jgi:hypothetical protein
LDVLLNVCPLGSEVTHRTTLYVPGAANVRVTECPRASRRPSASKSHASATIGGSSIDVDVKVTGSPAVGAAGS